MLEKLTALIAAFNDGANKGFWRVQPRDDEGKWMEMGRGSLSYFRMPDGSIVEAVGTFLGGTGEAGYGWVLIKGHDIIPDGKYRLSSKHMHKVEGYIPESALVRQGIKKSSVVTDQAKIAGKNVADFNKVVRAKITSNDERIARGDLTPDEVAQIAEGRANSPLANLPAGYEVDNPEAVDQMLRDAGVDVDGAAQVGKARSGEAEVPSASEAPAAPSVAERPKLDLLSERIVADNLEKADGQTPAQINRSIKKLHDMREKDPIAGRNPAFDVLISELGKKVTEKGGTPYTPGGEVTKPKKGSPEDLGFKEVTSDFDKENNQQVWEKEYEGGQILLEVSKTSDGSYEATRYSNPDRTGAWSREDVLDVATDKNAFQEADKKVNDALDEEAAMDRKYQESMDKADAAAEKAIKDAMEGKPVNLDDVVEESYGAPPGGKDDDDDFSWFFDDEEEPAKPVTPEPTPTPTPEPVAKTKKVKEPTAKTTPEPAKEPITDPDSPAIEPTVDPIPTPVKEVVEEPKPTVEEVEEAIAEVAKMTNDQLDALGKPEDYLQDTKGILPSQEQTRAINAIVKADVDVVIDALAGAGKTWTLTAAVNALTRIKPDARVLVLVFGKANQVDAERKIKNPNAEVRTTHSVAYRQVMTPKKLKHFPGSSDFKTWSTAVSLKDIAAVLETDDTNIAGVGNIDAEDAVFLIQKALSKFCNSSDKEITKKHILSALQELDGFNPDAGEDAVPDKLLKWAKDYWADVSGDREVLWDDKKNNGPGKKMGGPKGKKRIAINQDHYLKMWSLSDPDLSQYKINGKPVTHVFFDEAQDTNPTVSSVLKRNKGKVQRTYVGDPNQAIFGFRGAENFLDEAKIDAGAVVDLTRTRRFGDGLTAAANAFLNLIGSRRRIKGVGSGGELVDSAEKIEDGPDTTILTRTNYKALELILDRHGRDEVVGVMSKFYEELVAAVYTLKWLTSDFKDRTPKPRDENGMTVFSEDFIGIKTLKDLMKKADRDPKSRAARWLDLYFKTADGDIKILTDAIKSLKVDKSDIGEVVEKIDTSLDSSGTLWIDDKGRPAEYSINKYGKIQITGTGTLGYVSPDVALKDVLKEHGFKWNNTEKAWETSEGDSELRQKLFDTIDRSIPNRTFVDNRVANINVSTAHRAKGLEWDNVRIADDFSEPEVNPETGKIDFPSEEELKLAYVALSRAKQKLYAGGLSWGLNYTGRDGLDRANKDRGRKSGFGADAWDYHEAQMAEGNDEPIKESASPASRSSYDDFLFITDANDEAMSTPTPAAEQGSPKTPKDVNNLSGWTRQSKRQNKSTKSVGGVTWELTSNKDGSITLRSRNDASIPTKKYANFAEFDADFKNQTEAGRQSSKAELKKILSKFDKDGKLAKLVDSGASRDEIFKAISNSDEWEKAVDANEINISSLGRALNRYGVSMPSRKTKPTSSQKKKPRVSEPEVKETQNKIVEFARNAGRMDDGKPVGRAYIEDENGNKELISDEQLEQLFKDMASSKNEDILKSVLTINPDAKVLEDGSIVYYRATKRENGGPASGLQREVSLIVKDNKDSSISVIVRVTNPQTGESKDYYHYSRHHSLASLIGTSEDQKAGLERLLSYYFDRDLKKFPFKDEQQKAWYGGVEGAVKFLRRGKFSRILSDRGSDDTTFKLRTPEEHAMLILNGRDKRFNKSLEADKKVWHTVMRKERMSLYEAIENGNKEAAFRIFNSYITSIPDTEEAKSVALSVVSDGLSNKFPNLDQRELMDVFRQIADQSSESLPATGLVVTPHLDRNNVPIIGGSVVRWHNITTGDSVVGRIRQTIRRDNPNDGNFNYGDYAIVDFPETDPAKAEAGETFGIRLNTKNMEVVSEDTPLTQYKGWIKNDDAKLARYVEAGYDFNPETGEFFDKVTGAVIDKLGSVGGDDEDGNISFNTKKVSGLSVGDILHDDDGDIMGKIVKIKANPNNPDQVGIQLEDGEILRYNTSDDINYSNEPGGSNAPEEPTRVGSRDRIPPVGPVKTASKRMQPKTQAAKRAASLGLAGSADNAPARILSRNSDDIKSENNKKNIQAIPGTSKVAIKPTDEAREAKNTAIELGREMLADAEAKALTILSEMGYDVRDAKKVADFDIVESAKKTEAEALKIKTNLEKKLDNVLFSGAKKFKESKKYEATIEAMKQEQMTPLKLTDALKEAGYRQLAYRLEANRKDGNLAVFAYHVLKDGDPRIGALGDNIKEATKSYSDAKDRSAKAHKNLKYAVTEANKQTLSDHGIELDSVSFAEFNGRLRSERVDLATTVGNTYLSAEAMQEVFDRIPSNWIRQAIKYLEDNGMSISIKAIGRTKRGSFKRRGKTFEVELSTITDPVTGQTRATDTAIHEFTHGLQRFVPNLRALEHAFTYDKIARDLGTENESLPNIMQVPGGKKSELTFAADNVANSYMVKQYPKPDNKDAFLNPNSDGSEVMTMLMQDLMTEPGIATGKNSKSTLVIAKNPKDKRKKKVYDNVKYDEDTKSWLDQDGNPINDIIGVVGSKVEKSDDESRAFAFGTLLVLSDFDPLQGVGPGNAVVVPPKSKKKK